MQKGGGPWPSNLPLGEGGPPGPEVETKSGLSYIQPPPEVAFPRGEGGPGAARDG